MKILPILLCTASSSLAQSVFTTDFNGTLPAEITPGSALAEGVQEFAGLGTGSNLFSGNFLRSSTANLVKLELTNLPAHSTVSIGFLLAAIDSLDGTGSYPSGDYFHIKLDGVTIFRESLANAVQSQVQSYIPAPGAQLARWQDLGFSGPGSFYRDSAYNFALEPSLRAIPHSSSTLTIEWIIEGAGVQSLGDESWAMDNLSVSLDSPAIPQNLRWANRHVSYPVGTTPYFTGLIHGAAPLANATLQASTDLGITDAWQNLVTLPANANGSVSYTDVPDPSAAGSPRNFYRVVTEEGP